MWVVYIGREDVAQFETRDEAEIHAYTLNDAYRTNAFRVEFEEFYYEDEDEEDE